MAGMMHIDEQEEIKKLFAENPSFELFMLDTGQANSTFLNIQITYSMYTSDRGKVFRDRYEKAAADPEKKARILKGVEEGQTYIALKEEFAEQEAQKGGEVIDSGDMDKEAEAFDKSIESLTPEEAAKKDEEIDQYITKEKVSELTQHMQVYGDERDDALVDFVAMDAKMAAYEGVKQGSSEEAYNEAIAGAVEETEMAMAQSAATEQYAYESSVLEAQIQAEQNPEKKAELEKELKSKEEQRSDIENITTVQDCKDRNIDLKNNDHTFASYMATKMTAMGKKVDKLKARFGESKIGKFFRDTDKKLADKFGKKYTITRDLLKIGAKIAVPYALKAIPVVGQAAAFTYGGIKLYQGIKKFREGYEKHKADTMKKLKEAAPEKLALEEMAKNHSPEFTKEKQARLKELQDMEKSTKFSEYMKSHKIKTGLLLLSTVTLSSGVLGAAAGAVQGLDALNNLNADTLDNVNTVLDHTQNVTDNVDNVLDPINEARTGVGATIDAHNAIHGDKPKQDPKGVWGKLKTAWEKTGRSFEQLTGKLSPSKKRAMEKEIAPVQQQATVEKQAQPAKKGNAIGNLFSKMKEKAAGRK